MLRDLLVTTISEGLSRGSVTTPSKWAEKYRVMGQPFAGPWTFRHHPWLREMHDADEDIIVGMKAAQMGYTEVALNKTFFTIDILRESVLYILPAKSPDAADFSASRFDPALELSDHLRNIFSDVKNVGHKRAGNASLLIRGSRARSQLKSAPASRLILDELDEFVADNVPMIFERSSGQLEKQAFLISTPTIEGFGIHRYFQESSQDKFMFRCPHCSKYLDLIFPRNLVITAEQPTDRGIRNTHLICHHCKHKLEHADKPDFLAKAKWQPTYSDRLSRGFYINQMYSTVLHPSALGSSYLRGLFNPAEEQEFFNSKLGLCHVSDGARLTDQDITACIGSTSGSSDLITMGVDVGKWLHCVIIAWKYINDDPDPSRATVGKVLCITKIADFESLDTLIRDYKVVHTVIDAHPERRKALEFAQRHRAHLCFYIAGIATKVVQVDDENVKVDRTTWLDATFERVRRQRLVLPVDTPIEYKMHMKASVRVSKEDRSGNPVGRYINSGEDHYAHASNYCEIALVLAAGNGSVEDISGVY